jgi:hypothetical protein
VCVSRTISVADIAQLVGNTNASSCTEPAVAIYSRLLVRLATVKSLNFGGRWGRVMRLDIWKWKRPRGCGSRALLGLPPCPHTSPHTCIRNNSAMGITNSVGTALSFLSLLWIPATLLCCLPWVQKRQGSWHKLSLTVLTETEMLYLHNITFFPGKWLTEPERAGFLSTSSASMMMPSSEVHAHTRRKPGCTFPHHDKRQA